MSDDRQPSSIPQPPSIMWATAFVRALAAGGLSAVCISPGSRSTPLAFAFQADPLIRTYVQLDERSAGFFALGLALGTGKPVALLCTSGTAGANYFPAVIEARMSEVPLLVITADRPHELRYSGANQTIDQVKLFGDQVLWAVDMALPEADAPAAAWRNLERTAVRALAHTDGLHKGPVHLNFPFRRPLEPARPAAWPSPETPLPSLSVQHGHLVPTPDQLAWQTELVAACPRGLIVVGPRAGGPELGEGVDMLAAATGYPVLADPLSGLRFRPAPEGVLICSAYENYLHHDLPGLEPELILRLGAMPVSQRLGAFMARQETAVQVLIRESGTWADEAHVAAHLLQVNPGVLCAELARHASVTIDPGWGAAWGAIEEQSRKALAEMASGPPFDAAYVAALLRELPPGTQILAGNSLPVRHIDQFGSGSKAVLSVFGNRGASGIDGNISTGMGLAAGTDRPVVILVGDITFFHDSNGLLAARHLGLENVTIVLLNNNGGGIFRRLPVADFEPPFRELFQTPHDLDFAGFAATYGFRYHRVDGIGDFRARLAEAVADPGRTIIEVQTDADADYLARAALEERLRRAIETA